MPVLKSVLKTAGGERYQHIYTDTEIFSFMMTQILGF